jgi:hypothetical protein
MDEAEMLHVFQRFNAVKKRAVLQSVISPDELIAVSLAPSAFRDVLTIIVKFVDLRTFARLKQVCQDFNRYLPEYPALTKIRKFYEREQELLPNEIIQCMEEIFKPCAIRLVQMIQSQCNFSIEWDNIAVVADRSAFSRRNSWWHIRRVAQIHFPGGLICKNGKPRGHIFQRDPMSCFTVSSGCVRLKKLTRSTRAEKEEKKKYKRVLQLFTRERQFNF